MATLESLTAELAQNTEQFNKLRKDSAAPEELEAVRKRLAELKEAIRSAKAADGPKDDGKKKERLLLKTAKVRLHIHLPGATFQTYSMIL